ncbi:MAG: helix-turn-helix transcriptional regulator [Christensenellaceae bacterium]|nr:helix-turn-helix transcriptional regulator [Christensenellaceae bacterium]
MINNIRKLRFLAHEMTQQQLADLTGVSRQTILAVEAGKYTPSLELAFNIALALGTTIEKVFIAEDRGVSPHAVDCGN